MSDEEPTNGSAALQGSGTVHEELGPVPELGNRVSERRPPGHEDMIRGGLAWAFVVIFSVTVVLAFWASRYKSWWPQAHELLQLLLPAETALLGGAVGFYFGARKNE